MASTDANPMPMGNLSGGSPPATPSAPHQQATAGAAPSQPAAPAAQAMEKTMPKWLQVTLGVLAAIALLAFIGSQLSGNGINIRSPITFGDGDRYDGPPPPSRAGTSPDASGDGRQAPPSPVCKEPGSVFVEQLGKCIFSMTNPAEVQRYAPDRDVDPRCKGKPPGHVYQEQITDPSRPGQIGTVNRICGRR